MAQAKNSDQKKKHNGANVGYEAELWQMADALRGSMDAAEYKHVVLDLIFLKYISDAFEEQHAKLEAEKAQGADPEDPDEYRALSIFWVPPEARWSRLKAQAKQPTIGQLVDDAMAGIERDNASLKGVLPKEYARPALDKQRLGQLIDMISNIDFHQPSPEPSPTGRGSEMQYRGGYDFSGLVEWARELRKKQTRAEDLLWQLLRNRQLCGAKFRRQHQFGDYLCDFYCDDAKLVVECDGDPHDEPARIEHDAKRDAYLRSQGLKVLRFRNERVLNDLEKVLEEIATHLLPSPAGRRVRDEGGQEMHGKSYDLLGRVYEYFLSMFASAEGKKGGEFYTPRSVVKLLVEMIEPYNGRVYDPCCGSSGMFVQSIEFIHAHKSGNGNGGKARSDISIYGQESNYTTWRLAKMNLALRGIDGQIAHGDTFHNDRHPDLKADFILANGSMSSNQSGEGEIRKNMIEADLVDCMIALPGQLFYSTQIPACLWFICRDKSGKPSPAALRHPLPVGEGRGEGEPARVRDRRGEVLFIDARKMGRLVDRTHRELTDEEIRRIANAYHAWRIYGPRPVPKGEEHYRGGFDFSGLVQTARELRKKQTPAESVMWELLRDRRFMNLKCRRQHQVGDYVVDFYCDEKKLALELDGPVHNDAERKQHDQKRDAYLRTIGLTVLRFRNEDVADNPENVFAQIAVAATHPSPLGRGAGGEGVAVYRDLPGFCKSATLDEIRKHGHVLTPGRYVGAKAEEDDGELFEEKMQRLTATLREQQAEAAKLDAAIAANLKELGYGG